MAKSLPPALGVLACALALLVPTFASAHLERPSYWPDPAVEQAGGKPTGGKVPKARSLGSAVTGKGPGEVRVVCKGNSLGLAERSIETANKRGFRIRPSVPRRTISDAKAEHLLEINEALADQCSFASIQKAIWRSGNNDRVVIMPGRYTEPKSRQAPTADPKCDPSLLQKDASGNDTPSYEYQATCPNDQNLIHVAGRAIKGDPQPPREDRQGIPEEELGDCIRCNLQLEGSGAKPTDVLLDGGKGYDNARNPDAEPGGGDVDCGAHPDDCYATHVVLRVDRADGFVGRNFLVRGAKEHGFYAEEVDGVFLDRAKFFWAADYGHLSFTSDHHLVRNCDGYGAGDAAIYPGASPETGAQADKSFYPDAPRINTVIKKCDMRGSDLGFSGSMGNATRITKSDIYGNVSGIVLDTLSSAGHPGFPADSSKIDHNNIYSNNLDLFTGDPPVRAVTPAPMGVGIVYAGMNDARVHDNRIFDNWRHAAMLFSVPDALVSGGGPEGEVNPGIACPGQPPEGGTPPNGISTSCGNHFFDNILGRPPQGFRFPPAIDQYGDNAHGDLPGPLPNGVDFWWDEFAGNTENCWFDNIGPDGTEGSVTGPGTSKPPSVPPDILPDCIDGTQPETSVGQGDLSREAYLVECSNGPDEDTGPLDCDWWQRPPEPGSAKAAKVQEQRADAAAEYAQSPEGKALQARLDQLGQ